MAYTVTEENDCYYILENRKFSKNNRSMSTNTADRTHEIMLSVLITKSQYTPKTILHVKLAIR